MATNPPIRDEDVIFYVDIVAKKFDKKSLVKALSDFVILKKATNPTGYYAVFMWETGKIPNFSTNFVSSEEVVAHIDRTWKVRDTEESYFENGLFYCLSYIATEYVRSDEKNLRIIVLSDSPSNPADAEKAQALIDLVEKFKWFPTFIDIIRIGSEKFYPDDVKLRIITTTANGGLFYIDEEKGLRDNLVAGLVKRKSLEVLTPLGGNRYIDDEHHAFFANMASNLVTPTSGFKPCSLCGMDICPTCGDPSDAPFVCPSCTTSFHDCCAARYSVQHHIGIKYIFRCPNCDALLKIDPDKVAQVEQDTEIPIATPTAETGTYDRDLLQEIMQEDKLVPLDQAIKDAQCNEDISGENTEQPLSTTPGECESESEQAEGAARFIPVGKTVFFRPHGPAVKKHPPNAPRENEEDAEVWQPPPDVNPPRELSPKQGPTSKPSAKKDSYKGATRVLLCKICGQVLPPKVGRCPNCGSIVPRT